MEKEDKDGLRGHASFRCLVYVCPESFFCSLFLEVEPAGTGVKAASYQRCPNAMPLPESALI